MNLKRVGVDDYFCRFVNNYVKKCSIDVFVVVFHPSCNRVKDKDAKRLMRFLCSKKCSVDDAK
ncbi:hypothetical protein Hanom_Chr08g00708831 [Helianthus anomalus]